ncbi:helix-turn-helix domain-containing protein [Cohnella silvisoli]|uniref:AraC family transcriptional regulator n=1 Tax=Cohnella silvisoli TaxID=2873699 RepID=A0ABV1KSP3_9BACL|nr:AraC family transcriptional regulator [Cohnella silvisoli]MCD9021357.1 AraC family transcriptional regulator [Cohnella silvisoli]
MSTLFGLTFAPYIRHADEAVREPWSIPARRTLDYLLVLVDKGTLFIDLPDGCQRLDKGEFALVQPNVLHALRAPGPTVTPYIHFDIFYSVERMQGFSTRPSQVDLSEYRHLLQPSLNDLLASPIPLRVRPSKPDAFRHSLLQAIRLWKLRQPLRSLEANLLVGEFVLMLLDDYSASEPAEAAGYPPLHWMKAYLSIHLSDPLTVDDMARQAHLSKSRFNVLFREQFGMPPHQYLLRLRIQHACELLRNGSLSLKLIAELCGFADIHHFTKAFRSETGLTPGSFRKIR